MSARPLNTNGHEGRAERIGVRMPDGTLSGVVLAAAARDISISEFIRHCVEVEMVRLEIELAEAAGMAVLPVPDRGAAPPG